MHIGFEMVLEDGELFLDSLDFCWFLMSGGFGLAGLVWLVGWFVWLVGLVCSLSEEIKKEHVFCFCRGPKGIVNKGFELKMKAVAAP